MHYVAEWRAYRDLSLRELELRMEYEPGEPLLSYASLGRIERGEQALTPDIMHALADALHCGPEDLLLVNPTIEPELIDFMAEVRRIRALKDPEKIDQAKRNLRAVA